MQQRLHHVLAVGYVGKAVVRVAEHGVVDRRRLTGLHALDVDAEDLRRVHAGGDLEPRLGLRVLRKDQDQPAVDRTVVGGGGE